MKPFALADFTAYAASIPEALDAAQASTVFTARDTILVKPNLVNASPFPVTTHPDSCRAVLAYIRDHAPRSRLIIADGCGDPRAETPELFTRLGFLSIAREFGAELLDLNDAPLTLIERPDLAFFKTIRLPSILLESCVVSLAVLKAHSLAGYSGVLKNMMGVLPPLYYAQRHGFWRKAALHADLQRAISELCAVARPDVSVLDASVGLRDHHLGGRECDPPLGKIIAGSDPWEVDRFGAGLLGMDWRTIEHLRG